MTIDPCQRRAERFLAGEMPVLEYEAFLQHARTCETCDSLVALDAELRGAPPAARLTAPERDAMRASGPRQLPAGRERREARGRRPRWPVTALLAAAAVLLLAIGAAADRVWLRAVRDEDGKALVGLITQAATGTRTMADIENAPYSFSNATFRAVDATSVEVSFDVSRHLELTLRRSDPLVRQLVVDAVLTPAPIGPRLTAISYAEGVADRAVIDALRIAMLDDPSPAVRLSALAALEPYKTDPEIQSALLTVVTTSDSVPMRLQAIDYLVDGRVDPQKMRTAMAALDPVEHAAALIKAGSYIR